MNKGDCEERGVKVLKQIDNVVICLWEGRAQTFVTWRIDLEGEFNLGHYFGDIEDAVRDFQSRVSVGRGITHEEK